MVHGAVNGDLELLRDIHFTGAVAIAEGKAMKTVYLREWKPIVACFPRREQLIFPRLESRSYGESTDFSI